MELKIFGKLKEYVQTTDLRFHTPGHKGNLCQYDITEIDDTFPGDCITDAQKKASKFFGSTYCRFLVGGSSVGMKASIMAVAGDILAPVDRHPCVDEGVELAKVKLFEYSCGKENGLEKRPTADIIEKYLDDNPSIKAVVLLSPDYYGRVVDKSVANAIKSRGKLLIVDSAHGAHFPASKNFPQSYSMTADFCNLSGHKTLPCYTQSAYLTINNDTYIQKVDQALKLLGTTSPSYLLLASLEYGIEYAIENSTHYKDLYEQVQRIKKNVPTLSNDDFTRLVVDTGDDLLLGHQLYFALKQIGIVAEKYDERYVVFIISVSDKIEQIKELGEKLICAVNSLQLKAAKA